MAISGQLTVHPSSHLQAAARAAFEYLLTGFAFPAKASPVHCTPPNQDRAEVFALACPTLPSHAPSRWRQAPISSSTTLISPARWAIVHVLLPLTTECEQNRAPL